MFIFAIIKQSLVVVVVVVMKTVKEWGLNTINGFWDS